jgi:nucleoside-diphosphate-sugar epimerase
LEAARRRGNLKVVFASSSSVYGNAATTPTPESEELVPISPYGVTKLAAEKLCVAYARDHNLAITSLRYFSVYGPRQRPDMAMYRLIDCALTGRAFEVYGHGEQRRDFTFVSDVVQATMLAGAADVAPGEVYNVSGGSQVTLAEVIDLVARVVERPLNTKQHQSAAGDASATWGDIEKIGRDLHWQPTFDLQQGLKAQVEWQRR